MSELYKDLYAGALVSQIKRSFAANTCPSGFQNYHFMRGLHPVLTPVLGITNSLLFFVTEKIAMFRKRACCNRLGAYIYCFLRPDHFKQRQHKATLIKASVI